MYQPAHFAVDDPRLILDLVRSVSFGHLVVATDAGLLSTPMPFVIDDQISTVRAHLARPNDVWSHAPCDALLIVGGADGYVSPRWYPSKAEHGKVVPTWNYEVVHLHGRLTAHDDATWLRELLRTLTDEHEASMARPWSIDDPPDDFIDRQLGAIVGIELEVTRVEAKRKLSQNRPADDRLGVLAGLRDRGDRRAAAVADAMDDT